MLLKIGEFSRLGHVTVKTLRHYAEAGLLKPAWIDRFTGYRYYSLDQLPRLNRILALKELGFSLDQVTGLLDGGLPVAQMRALLERKQVELESRLRAEQSRLALVAARLEQIEAGGAEPEAEVALRRVETLPVAALRATAPALDRVPHTLAGLADRLLNWAAARGVRCSGHWLVLYPDPEYRERNLSVELALPVEPGALKKPAADAVTVRELPGAADMACMALTGPRDTPARAAAGLYAWLERHRCRPAGAVREVYLRAEKGWTGQPVEVQIPVTRPLLALVDWDYVVDVDKEHDMDIRFVELPAFTVVGMAYHGKNQNNEIAQMWGEFNRRYKEIEISDDAACYGVCRMLPELPQGEFEYVAGWTTRADAPVPEGMVKRSVPALRYAVFAHRGAAEGLRETYRKIYEEWLPQAGLKPLELGLDMEVYTEEFKFFTPESVMYIYVPVA